MMGNSKTKPGIFVTTSQTYYYAGQQIQGNVYINAPTPYPCTQILLSITGYQKIDYPQNSIILKSPLRKNSSISIPRTQRNSKMQQNGQLILKIIDMSKILIDWKNDHKISGQFQLPFVLYTNSYLPASYKEQNNAFKAHIYYEISCILISGSPDFRDLIQRKQLIIRHAKTGDNLSIKSKKDNNSNRRENWVQKNVHAGCCCCCFCSSLTIGFGLQKKEYEAGTECQVLCQIYNEEHKLHIWQLRLQLIKQVKLKSRTNQQTVYRQQISKLQYPSLLPVSYQNQDIIRIPIILKSKQSQAYLPPYTRGRLIQCNYILQLSVMVKKCCRETVETLQSSINIVHPGGQECLIEAPKDWNPEIFKQSSIVLEETVGNYRLHKMQDYHK